MKKMDTELCQLLRSRHKNVREAVDLFGNIFCNYFGAGEEASV